MYCGLVISEIAEWVGLDSLAPREPWQTIVLWIELGFLVVFLAETIVGVLVNGPSHLVSSLHGALDTVLTTASLVLTVFLLSTGIAALGILRISRYVKLVAAYNRLLCMRHTLRRHAKLTARLAEKADQASLEWKDGSPLRLPAPLSPGGYHVFISHVWRYAQDTAGTRHARHTLALTGPSEWP